MGIIISPFCVQCDLCTEQAAIPSYTAKSPERMTLFREAFEKRHKCPVRRPQQATEPVKTMDERWVELFGGSK